MTTYYLSPFASFLQVLNDAGVVTPGLLMWTYAAGTSTPAATYTDITGGTPNSNPIQLNSAGRLPNVSVWQAGGIALKIQFSTNAGTVGAPVFGVQIGPTFDQVSGINDPAALLTTLINPASGSGVDLIANAMKSYDLVATVRAANVPSLAAGQTLIIDIEGGVTVNDGLGGLFYWNATSTAVDDGGATTIKPTAAGATGRFIRLSVSYGTSGTFTATVSLGLTTTPTMPVQWFQNGNLVTLQWAGVSGTSNATTFRMTGLPSNLYGISNVRQTNLVQATDNTAATTAYLQIGSAISSPIGSTIQIFNNVTSGLWTNVGTKALLGGTVSYILS